MDKNGVRIFVALIGAAAVVIAAMLSNEKITDRLLGLLDTKVITIPAAESFTGTAIFNSGNDLLSLSETNTFLAAGDTENDQLVHSYYSFYLGDIPKNSQIISAQLDIPCDIYGYPEPLLPLTLREFPFATYEQVDFYAAPKENWAAQWDNAMEACKSPYNVLVLQTLDFKELLQNRLASSWLQFVMFLNDNMIIPNQSIDGIVLVEPPILKVKYRELSKAP